MVLASVSAEEVIVADDQQAIPVSASSVKSVEGAVIDADRMDMDVSHEQAIQESANSASQHIGDSQDSVVLKQKYSECNSVH